MIHKGADAAGDDMSVGLAHGDDLADTKTAAIRKEKGAPRAAGAEERVDTRLNRPLPTGERAAAVTGRGARYGTQFHALMDLLTSGAPRERAEVRQLLGIAEREFAPMWEQAQRVLSSPALARFFDASQYEHATNEVSYVIETGDVRRIDRLVEFENELWVLDYKTGNARAAGPALIEEYRAQLADYCAAVRRLYARQKVSGALVFADAEVELLDGG
jgi:ATP-dependent helicase/nuclease subunit A